MPKVKTHVDHDLSFAIARLLPVVVRAKRSAPAPENFLSRAMSVAGAAVLSIAIALIR